jgi:hypothetical protein
VFWESVHLLTAIENGCEKVGVMNFWQLLEKDVKTCFMEDITVITSPGEILSTIPDDSIMLLSFDENKNISYLPEKVDEKYSNLLVYTAENSNVQTISRNNFKGLIKLRFLYLQLNQIEMIERNTFQDLISLERLNLSKFRFILISSNR